MPRISKRIKAPKNKRTKARGRSFTPRSFQTVVGVVEKTASGFGFLVVENKKPDAFIAKRGFNGAMHGDKVRARIFPSTREGGEAEVERVLERRNNQVVGTYFANRFGGFIIPDDAKVAKEILIERSIKIQAEDFDKAVIKIDFTKPFSKRLTGSIIEVLGKEGESGVDILSVARRFGLDEKFPKEVINEASIAARPLTKEEKEKRLDLTSKVIFTIDGDDSKDFDDAVSIEILENNNFLLGVHIADVSHFVLHNSFLDKEAFNRGTSVYFVDRVFPMLPKILSNDICSLNEGVERATISCIIEITSSGEVVKSTIKKSFIKSCARLSYSSVSALLDKKIKEDEFPKKEVIPHLENLFKLYLVLDKKRKARGSIDFDIPESQIVLDENKVAVDVYKKERLIGHKIIEECMLEANEAVARFLHKIKAPAVFRVHEKPPQDKITTFLDFLSSLAVPFSFLKEESPTPKEFSTLLETVKDKSYKTAVSKIGLRTMSKAKYATQDEGHFGLALKNYCHFTSPIRRYPDLCVHRVISDYLENQDKNFSKYATFFQEAAIRASEKERAAEKAEREVESIKKAEFMKDKIGKAYTGFISSVTDFGIFVELENTVEGLAYKEDLNGGGFEFQERKMCLTNGITTYKLGDKLEVEVVGVERDRVRFNLVYGTKRRK